MTSATNWQIKKGKLEMIHSFPLVKKKFFFNKSNPVFYTYIVIAKMVQSIWLAEASVTM